MYALFLLRAFASKRLVKGTTVVEEKTVAAGPRLLEKLDLALLQSAHYLTSTSNLVFLFAVQEKQT